MEKGTSTISTDHTEMIHDVKPDYFNKHIATCSSDRLIKVYESSGPTKIADLVGHKGPVWQLSWANPKFGTYLASCSYDRKLIVWKQQPNKQFTPVYTYEGHELSVNSVEFAPQEVGLVLAAGSSDGYLSIHSFRDGKWESKKEKAHSRGVNAVSWSPVVPGAISSSSAPPRIRLASAGCDNFVRVWRFDENTLSVTREDELTHTDWVRDVSWAPNIASPSYVMATGTQDGKVTVWSQNTNVGIGWKPKTVPKETADIVWRVSWSITGSILAVSSGEGSVTLWRETPEEEWKCLSKVEQDL